MTRFVRPGWLFAETTRADWASLYKGVQVPTTGALSAVQLFRWALHKDLGLPREPFTIWERKAQPSQTPVPLPGGSVTATPLNQRDIPMPVQAMRVSLVVATPSGALTLDAYDAGGTRITGRTVDQGASGLAVVLTGSGIARVRASGAGQVSSVTFISASQYANLPDWTPVEMVGLPVEVAGSLPYSTANQGMATSPASPADAAQQRLLRAAPQAGWPVPTGFSGPDWAPPDIVALITAYQQTLISDLMSMLTDVSDPTQHGVYQASKALPQPQDQLGGAASSAALGQSSALVPPLGLLAMACHGDMYAALALGFATGYPSPEPSSATATDYMVTVNHKFTYQLGGFSLQFAGELAAFFAPAGAARPPVPALLQAAPEPGGPRPAGRDQPRVCSVAVSWDRGDTMAGSMQAVSAAVARALPSGTPRLLVTTRPTGGPVPFVAAKPVDPDVDEAARATFTDGVFPDLSEPTGTYTYLVCGQNRWGMWGNWAQAALSPAPETAQQPLLVGVGLELADPASPGSTRGAILTIDLSWDWHDRSPLSVEVVAAYIDPAEPPPPAPTVLVFDPLGSAASLTLQWAQVSGAAQDPPQPTLSGCTVIRSEPVQPAGDHSPPDEVGRYRVTAPVTLDFGSSQGIRVACWIRGTEEVSGLTSDWTPPRTATARTPVPPLPPGPPGPLTWASLPDATGRSRAHLAWAAAPGAASYVVYHADETALLAAAGQPPPDLSQPPSQRKASLDAVVRIESVRDAFLRVSPDPVTGTSYDVELPRGSRVLHGFVVLARSATGVESPWPATPPVEVGGRGYTLMGIPRPRVPKPPVLSAAAASPTSVTIMLAPAGDPVERVDLHRTALARLSGDVGTMGSPITTLVPAGSTWPDYADTVTPSWQPYWYRAVAWGATDDDNGWRTSPGPASAARAVLVPPATPPVVIPGSIVPASGTTPGYVTFTTDAPPVATSLGRFALRVIAITQDSSGTPGQAVLNTTLDAITPSSSVPSASADVAGPAWLADDGSIGVVLNPASGTTIHSVLVSVTDPLGRAQPDPTEVLP